MSRIIFTSLLLFTIILSIRTISSQEDYDPTPELFILFFKDIENINPESFSDKIKILTEVFGGYLYNFLPF